MNRITCIFLIILPTLLFACSSSKEKETPVTYKPRITDNQKPIVPVPNDGSFFGKISFEKNNKINILMPDSTEIIGEQSDPTTRKYRLAQDNFLIFVIKNTKKGFQIFSNDNKALWQVSLQNDKITISQKGMSKNEFEILIEKKNLSLRQNDSEVGKVVLEGEKAIFYKKDKQLFSVQTDKMLPAFGILLIDEMGIEEKYAALAEAVARGY